MFRWSLLRLRTTILGGFVFLIALGTFGANFDRCFAGDVITGRVVDEAGQPVGGIQVQFFDWSKYQGYRPTVAGESTTTDDDGTFQITKPVYETSRLFDAWFVARDLA